MGCVQQHVVRAVGATVLYLLYFLPDGQHGIDEVVQFGQAFAFGRFNHQRAVHGEREGGGMVAVVHQSFGDVVLADTCFGVDVATFQNHLVSHEAVGAAVDYAVGVLQAGGQVVGVEDGNLCGAGQSFGSHHADVAVGDGQDACTAPGG